MRTACRAVAVSDDHCADGETCWHRMPSVTACTHHGRWIRARPACPRHRDAPAAATRRSAVATNRHPVWRRPHPLAPHSPPACSLSGAAPGRTRQRRRPMPGRQRVPTPQPGLRPAAVALRAAQNSGLPCSSDRRAPDPSRQSADGCALWSRLETRYLRLPSPLRHNIFRQTRAPFGPHSDEDLRWRPVPLKPATLLPSSPTNCRKLILKLLGVW